MKGKILEIDGTGSWTGKYGEMFTYIVRVKTDDQIFTGEVNAKSGAVGDLPYKIGDEVEFEHEPASEPQYNDKMKIKKEGGYLSGEKSEYKNRGFALRFAADLAIARIRATADQAEFSKTEDVIDQADKFVQWLDS